MFVRGIYDNISSPRIFSENALVVAIFVIFILNSPSVHSNPLCISKNSLSNLFRKNSDLISSGNSIYKYQYP